VAHALRERAHRYAVVVPVINEGLRIKRQLMEMEALPFPIDIVVADGGSNDGSVDLDVLKEFRQVRSLLIKTGPGRLSAQLRMAYAWCLESGYAGIVTIDGNGKDGVSAIADFFAKLDHGYDLVQGSRYLAGGVSENIPFDRYVAGRLIHAPLISLASRRFWYTDTTNGFRGYSRALLLDDRVDAFRPIFDRYQLLFYLSVRAPRLGFRVCETPVERRYPANAATPTKISGFRGRMSMMLELMHVAIGRYDPKSSSKHAVAHDAFQPSR
jgi:glycosyltransferase involved in cell wall biosynthesis